MKRNWAFLSAVVLFFISLGMMKASNTDIWNLSGQGIYNPKDMVHVDNGYNLRLYNGDIYLGDNALTPSTTDVSATPSITSGGFYGLKVPFFNGSGAATASGSVIVASTTFVSISSSIYEGSMIAFTATTTVLGVSEGVVANGAIGYMTVQGYALVQTTGTIPIGTLLVSTAGSNGAGAVGWAGAATGTVAVGTVIGKALTAGNAAGGTVLAIIGNE